MSKTKTGGGTLPGIEGMYYNRAYHVTHQPGNNLSWKGEVPSLNYTVSIATKEKAEEYCRRRIEKSNEWVPEEPIPEPEIPQETPSANTYQIGGSHYSALNVQPWDAMESWLSPEAFQGFLKGNAIKYLARKKESEKQDVEKAIHYLQKWLEVTAK